MPNTIFRASWSASDVCEGYAPLPQHHGQMTWAKLSEIFIKSENSFFSSFSLATVVCSLLSTEYVTVCSSTMVPCSVVAVVFASSDSFWSMCSVDTSFVRRAYSRCSSSDRNELLLERLRAGDGVVVECNSGAGIVLVDTDDPDTWLLPESSISLL